MPITEARSVPQTKGDQHDRETGTTRPARGQARQGRRARRVPRSRPGPGGTEAGTLTWYAFKISDTTYGIFDSFETEDARQAHLSGEIPTALGQVAADLLAKDPDIRTVDVIAVK